ncbi:MAG: DUF4439 domain-containing protein [Actinomycetes bacterium]
MTAAEALSALCSGEDAAIYAYSVAGARVAGARRRRALTALDSHRAHRDRIASMIVAADGTPPGSAVAYALPGPVGTPAAARELMALVDNGLVGLYADAAATLTGADRRWAVRTAAECAVSAVDWGAQSQAFPVAGTVAASPTSPASPAASAAPAPSASTPPAASTAAPSAQ